MIFATAGHVDHGKTSLIQAITGVNTAHLPEEKKRGMTIDLGYAYWPQPDGSSIGFIDVPGHEKFLANMLAGIGGINHALLVVACDDGVMAQTLEHLSILRLAGCENISVILTKADRVDHSRIEQVTEQVTSELAKQGWPDAKLFITSIEDGRGIDALRLYLQQLHQQSGSHPNIQRRFRLAIDRVFLVKGAGVVVTGTALAGKIQVGESLWVTGADKQVRVRGIHRQNQISEFAVAGDRVALNLVGDIDKENITRGDWLLAEQPAFIATRVIVELECDALIKHWQPVHLYHGASHITGRASLLVEQGETPVLAELILDTPLWLVENDRLIIRDISARQTLGGARVIRLVSPRRGKRLPEFLDWLSKLCREQDELAHFKLQLPQGELNLRDYSWARQLTHDVLDNLLAQMDVERVGNHVLSTFKAQIAKERIVQTLEEFNEIHSDQIGVGKARLKRMALPSMSEALAFKFIDDLIDENVIKQTRGWLHMPQHGLVFDAQQQLIWQQIHPLFSRNEAWWVRDLALESGYEEDTMRRVLKKAAQMGLITAIVRDRYYSHEQINYFASLIHRYCMENEVIFAADFRNELGIGRKLAIQILEFFDKSGFTRRKGDGHHLRDKGIFVE
ncbi:selenocysteine-specific translation elongation factor [Providencia hangzhouensis]|uniref:Selenocysteine-specific elongation factor n=1 Tax=Providencia rettgeri TaxID=587 RepID=A0A9N8H0K1_PRORE|nr:MULTISPECIES: selenocysteine-specific translation elongation factor [Providencia]MBN7843307.1 selenocysteine-specific translation elongation factor [Providencia rettgeri]MBN7853569.1 selenocysteine-specific translation elongation factor [Providencia rettgeri]MBN7862861.1 selenocysteine-specific translation elongation factor [Providencia rettgeri]MBN7871847.1 selenocysteine-specific translation elongation factor [Providencia rettgeri]MBN7897080.1 selenocysteine-specific translation elongatio